MKTASSSAAFEVAVPAEKKLMKKENSSIPCRRNPAFFFVPAALFAKIIIRINQENSPFCILQNHHLS